MGHISKGCGFGTSFGAICLLVVAFSAILPFTPPAAAGTVVNGRPWLFSFDGSDSSIGRLTQLEAIATDEETGDIYAINAAGSGKGPTGYGSQPGEWDDERVLCKFDVDGKAENFTGGESAGKSCLDGKETPGKSFGVEGFLESGTPRSDVAIDNSGGSGGPGEGEQGRLYLSEEDGPVHAFASDGTYLWTLPRAISRPCGIAVDTEGHLWVGNGRANEEALEFDNEPPTGSPPHTFPNQIGSVTMTHPNKLPCRLAIDKSGNDLYVGLDPGLPSSLDKYVEGHYASSFPIGYRFDLTIDQSKEDGHIFDTDGVGFAEHEPCLAPGCPGIEVSGSPFGGDLIGEARGIAYNPAKDWVYVSDKASNSVKVFGPVASGSVPDVSTEESEPVGLHSITAHGTINPLGLANSYHFEWKEGTGPNWGSAESSPPQGIEPTDSSPHAVSLGITKYNGKQIKSNATYQVRLVGANTENDLSAYASPDTATTLIPPAAEIEDCSASAIATGSAQVACSIDPKEEETGWQIMTKALSHVTQAECEALSDSGFQAIEEGTIPAEEPGTVEVGASLTGLLSAQSYCVRAIATNPGGGDEGDLSFKTLAILPSETSAAFAAPRTDTTARINARVNPNGEADFKYGLEWSEDGATWNALPIRESSIDAREPILLAEELDDLKPSAVYHYRLGLLENEAGAVDVGSLGGEKTFTTRSKAEVEEAKPPNCPANEDVRAAQHSNTYLGACRGIELVNNPDKGNQNASARGPGLSFSPPISAEGDKVVWSVTGGAPGGPNGTDSNFLAERTETGWSSKNVAPPAEEQAGKGDFGYFLSAVTPGFGSFLFVARGAVGLAAPPPPTFVRMREGEQDILRSYSVQAVNPTQERSIDLSDDGEHVLTLDPQTKQLEDIGAARVGPPEVKGEVVSLMPDGSPPSCGLDVVTGKSFPGLDGSGLGHPGDHWIASADASRVFFRARPTGECGGAYGLYVRNREAPNPKTTLIDPGDPEFLRASPDGHQGYFVTRTSLDPADTDPNSTDIYRWDEEAGTGGESSCLTCVVPAPAHLAEIGGALNGVLISADFSHIYFYSPEKLFPGQGKLGALNLYVLNGEKVRFVAVTQGDVLRRGEGAGLSAGGNELLFGAQATPALSADAMVSQCIQPGGGLGACRELYLYDDRDGSTECLSCDRRGTTTHSFGTPLGGTGVDDPKLSGVGTTAAFVTQEALVAADVNHDTDIYEWRNGSVHLITDGVSDLQEGVSAPRVWAVNADGSNIFFGVVPPGGKLTGFERDGVLNLYDARIGGGFEPPPPDSHCVEDSCQGPLVPAPALSQPASSGFQGRGNPKAPPQSCRKGKVRRHGRCVSRHPHKLHKRASHAKQGRPK